jgi:hypothetical protein
MNYQKDPQIVLLHARNTDRTAWTLVHEIEYTETIASLHWGQNGKLLIGASTIGILELLDNTHTLTTIQLPFEPKRYVVRNHASEIG